MTFEPNAGQTQPEVRFLSRGAGYTLFLSSGEAVLSLGHVQTTRAERRSEKPGSHHGAPLSSKFVHAALHMSLVDASPRSTLEGIEELPGTINYFIGNNPKQWRVGIHGFARVKYNQVYPGIDLVYYGNQRQLEYDFNLAAGAQAARIGIEFRGAKGLQIDSEGGLVIQLAGGSVHWARPLAYQGSGPDRLEVACEFVLRAENQVGFEVGAYDSSKPLVIDPVLVYSTYLGGSGFDAATAIAVNGTGNAYVAGDTASVNFPIVNAFDSTPNGSNDVFVAKLNPAGTALVYSTYFGGSGDDFVQGIAIDSTGNAYITGSTSSPNFPTKNAYQSAYNGAGDVFLSKIGPFGTNLLYSTYIGGTDYESGNAIAVDNSGNAYIAGETDSLISTGPTHPIPFPTLNGFQNNAGGGFADAFVAKFNTTLSGSASLVYSSFLGGSTDEKASGIAIDSTGNAYLTGQIMDSTSVYPTVPHSNFPVLNAFQSQFNQGSTDPNAGNTDGFVTKVSSAGSTKVFSTYLGGYSDDDGTDIAVDANGRIYVTGETSSTNFPTLRAAQPIIGGGNIDFPQPDVFITVFQSSGTALVYSTFLGGSGFESLPAIAVDQFGCVYVTGQTLSYDFPLTVGSYQTNSPGVSDSFVAKLSTAVPGPASLIYSTLLSGGDNFGNSDNSGNAIAVDTNGDYYVAGQTSATNFPVTTGVLSPTNHGSSDAFVARFSSAPDLSISMIPSLDPVIVGSNLTYTIQINNNGRSGFTGVTNQVQISSPFQIVSVSSTVGNWTTNNGVLTFNLGSVASNASITQTVVVASSTPAFTTNSANVTSLETASLEPNTGNNQATVTSTIRGIADIKLTSMTVTPNPGWATSNLTYTFNIDNKGPSAATSIVLTDALPASLSFVSASASQGTWTTNLGYVAFSLGTLASGTGASATIVAQVPTPGVVVNGAGVTAFELDSNPANNGASTTVTVNYPAVLGILRAGGNHVLYWSTSATGFGLQSTLALSTPSTWTAVTNNPVIVGSQYMVTNPTTGLGKFYRLAK
jgi:uncharacterized repeat protein (TIGR01451 family)